MINSPVHLNIIAAEGGWIVTSFNNTSQNIGSSLWMIDGVPFETQTNASYTFSTAGIFTITLQIAPANTALCETQTAQVNIQVVCPVTASFTLSNLSPDINETISVLNTSENATQTEWFINGISQGSVLDSISFDALGVFEIRLETSNGACGSSSSIFVYTQETCLNKTFEYEFNHDVPFLNYRAYSSTVLVDGNVIIAGILDTLGTSACFLTKLKLDGTILWFKRILQDSHSVSLSVVRATPDGGFALTFNTFSTVGNGYIAKFSANGNLEWIRQIPNSDAFDLLVLPDGNLVVLGSHTVKFSNTGNLIWSKGYAWGAKIVAMPDGGFLTIKGSAPSIMISRFNANANVLWHKTLSSDSNLSASDFLTTPEGDIYIVGKKEFTFNSIFHGLLLKLNANGETQWAKTYQQIPLSTYEFEAITLSAEGNIAIAGRCLVDDPGIGPLKEYHLLLKTDLAGNVLWSRHRPKMIETSDLNLLPEGGFFNLGNVSSASAIVWLLKTDAQGNTIGCPESPHQINVLDFNLLDSNLPGTLDDIIFNPVALTASVILSPLLIDTICAPFCVRPFEICNNNLDDDGDGLFDCLDPECNCTEDKCAPKQDNIWYFGQDAGLDFSTDPLTVLTDGNTDAFGISASISDANGALLFYTDGKSVFNRFHEVMPNGMIGNIVIAYNSIIIPNLDNSGQYYLAIQSNLGDLQILTIDMTLDNGKGDVVGPFLDLPENTGLAVTKNCNGLGGFWLLTHNLGPNTTFLALNIGQAGPSISIFSGPAQSVLFMNQLKISPDGKRVACTYFTNALFNTTAVAVYDFEFGTVSNLRELAVSVIPERINGLEFSPNGRFLYVTGNSADYAQVLQYDLEAGDLAAIQASSVVLAFQAVPGTSYPQLAPNGKIYVPRGSNFGGSANTLDVIHQPDKAGTLCNYQVQGQNLGNASGIGLAPTCLCNIISSNLGKAPRIALPFDAPDTICTLNTPLVYHIPTVACAIDSLVWTVENLDAQISPSLQGAEIRYLSPGSGQLIVTAYSPCGATADTLNVLVVAPLNQTIDLGPDLVVCQNGVFSFNAGSGFARYQWSDGTADSTITTLFPGKYWVNAWDLCGNLQTDTITVSIAPGSVLDLGPDLPQQCSGFSANYQRPANFDSWQWSPNNFISCADCPSITLSPTLSATWVVVAKTDQGCVSVDTLNATIRDTLLFSRDTFVCVGQTLNILGAQLPADTTAEFFLPAPGLGCDTLLTVNVLGIENAASTLAITICPNSFFEYHGVLLPADTVAIFHLASLLACDSVVTVKVNAYPPLNLTLPMDTTIRIGASVLLDTKASGTGTLNFAWSPPDGLSCIACPDPLANPLDTITYTLAVTDINGCTAQESVTIRVNEECRVRVPNAFTPNADGSNDRFRPIMDPCVRTVRLWRIVNRWGQTVFEQFNFAATDTRLGWDGNSEGKAQPSDVLIWVAEFEYYDGRRESKSGEVTLLR